jgi:hypothetical protein
MIRRETGIMTPRLLLKDVSEVNAPLLVPIMSNPALQNAETEWKMASHIPDEPYSLQKTGIITPAPSNSMKKAVLNTKPIIRTIPPTWCAEILSCSILRWKSEILLPEITAMKAVTEMTPRPPICIKIRITIWPKSDQYAAVSLTIRPVTQTADVAVKKASSNDVQQRALDETGSISRNVPSRITARKPIMMI